MDHREFGTRVPRGARLCRTLPTHEQHSATALRLSRRRRNDPAARRVEKLKEETAGPITLAWEKTSG
eukprot:2928761-Pyramimonas_sp.AAC.1